MNIAKDYNKYDYLIIALIACGASGMLFSPVTAQRLFAILSIPYLLTNINRFLLATRKYVKYFFFIWFTLSALSLLWTPDLSNGIKYFIYNIYSFNAFACLILFSLKAKKPIKSIILGWSILFLLTLPIAFNELINGYHLSISVQDDSTTIVNSLGERVQRVFASVTFGNLNTYTVVVVYCLSFILLGSVYLKKRIVYFGALLLSATYVLLMNSSRGGILCLAIAFIMYFILMRKQSKKVQKWIFIFFLLIVVFVINYADILLNQIAGRLITSSMTEDNDRLQLYSVIFKIFLDSFCMGSGIGGLQHLMQIINNGGISAPHNMLLEFLGQYGIIPFLFFISMIYHIIKKLITSKHNVIKLIGWITAATFIPLFIINSGYLTHSLFWVYWGSLYILGHSAIDRSKNEGIRYYK